MGVANYGGFNYLYTMYDLLIWSSIASSDCGFLSSGYIGFGVSLQPLYWPSRRKVYGSQEECLQEDESDDTIFLGWIQRKTFDITFLSEEMGDIAEGEQKVGESATSNLWQPRWANDLDAKDYSYRRIKEYHNFKHLEE